MTCCLSPSPALRAIVATGVIAALSPSAQALTAEAVVQVDAWTGGPANTTPLTTCIPTDINIGGLKLLGQDCSVPGAGTTTVRNRATAQAPAAFNPSDPASYQLARLGASSSLAMEVHSFAGTGRSFNDPTTAVTAQAVAVYSDYLMLGPVRPTSLQLDFHLSGELRLGAALENTFNPYQVDAIYGLGLGSGHMAADGAFASTDPYAYGLVQVRRQLKLFGATPTVEPWVDSHPDAALTHSETRNPLGGTDVRVTLGADFFNNPVNDIVLLQLSLASSVYGPAWTFKDLPSGMILTGTEISADFGSTFEMVGLQAFDVDGNDITASAVLGFQSLQAVPEPQAWLLFLAGLIGVALRRRREPGLAPRAARAGARPIA